MSETAAPLLAVSVMASCQQALREIELKRIETFAAIIRSKVNTLKYANMTVDQIIAALPPEERMIPSLHRVEDERQITLLLELALTIGEDNPDLRMNVSLDHFQLIKKFYMKRAHR